MPEPLLRCVEVEPEGGPATHSMILLHGLGADGHDLAPLGAEIALPAGVRMRFVLPHAPQRAVTLNGGMLMPAWYDIRELTLLGRGQDERGVRASAAQIAALIEREVARGIPEERIVLAGFSQGGAMALFTGLRHPRRLAAIIGMSCYLVLPELLEAERSAANAADAAHAADTARAASTANTAVPIFLGHGTHDPMVPLRAAEIARDALSAHGYAPEFRTYPMEHSIASEELSDIATFLAPVLHAPAPTRAASHALPANRGLQEPR